MRRSVLTAAVPSGAIAIVLLGWLVVATIARGAESTDSGDAGTMAAGVTTAEAIAANAADHDEEADYSWDPAEAVSITLTGDGATSASDAGVTIDGGVVTLTSAGTYQLTGELTDGRVVVDSADDGLVRLVLDGVTISNSTTCAIEIDAAEKVVIVLAEGSVNSLSDASTYVYPDADTDEPNAALFSKANLTITGGGTLEVVGNAYDGIASKDGLIIDSGTVSVASVDDGIRGKDYLVVKDPTLEIAAGGDGLTATNDSDETLGYVLLGGGVTTVASDGDGVSASTDIIVTGGSLGVTTGGGSAASTGDQSSAKGLKGAVSVVVGDGTITADSSDDAVHSDAAVSLGGGSLTLASGDDGIHAEATLHQSGGDLTVTTCVEGLESTEITITGGTVDITASDDGINGTDGVTDEMQVATDVIVTIGGGTVVVNANGDGLDSNGALYVTGGTVVVNGPVNNGNGALDANGTFTVSAGTLLAAGSSGMAVAPATTSEQGWVSATLSATQPANTVVHLTTSDDQEVVAYQSTKAFQSVVFSSDRISSGSTYNVYTGGTVSGTSVGGMYDSGSLDGATLIATVTAGEHSGGGMPGGPGGGGGGGGWPSGMMPSGEMPSGMMPPSGEMPSGMVPSGMEPSGDLPSGGATQTSTSSAMPTGGQTPTVEPSAPVTGTSSPEAPSASPSDSEVTPSAGSPSASASASATTAAPSPSTSRSGSRKSCRARYEVLNQWSGGFVGVIHVEASTSALKGWTVTWTFADGQTIGGAWNATVEMSGSTVTANGAAYNGRLKVSSDTTFGFIGTWTGSNSAPTLTCTGF